MEILQIIIFIGSGITFAIALLLWFLTAITALNRRDSATYASRNFALFFTAVSVALLIWGWYL